MDWLTKILGTVGGVAKAVGNVVDQVVPVGNGQRTSTSAIALAVIPYVKAFVPAKYQPLVDLAQNAIATFLPLFAVAHVVR